MTPIQREWTVGENVVQFEPPDLIRVKFKGACSRREAVQMVDICREVGTVHPFFIIGDMEAAGPLESEARHYFSERIQPHWIRGIIYYKARLLHKAIVMGLRLAMQMAQVEHALRPEQIHFVSTQDKAEALLAQLRVQ